MIFNFTCLPSHTHLIFLPAILLCFCFKPSLLFNLWKEINVQCEVGFLNNELHFHHVNFLYFHIWITPAHMWLAFFTFLYMWNSHCRTFSHLTVNLIFSHLETKHWTTSYEENHVNELMVNFPLPMWVTHFHTLLQAIGCSYM